MIKVSLVILIMAIFQLLGSEVSAQTTSPRIIAQAKTNIRELPRTGVPAFALVLAAILPGGLILKMFLKGDRHQESENSIWRDRQLKS